MTRAIRRPPAARLRPHSVTARPSRAAPQAGSWALSSARRHRKASWRWFNRWVSSCRPGYGSMKAPLASEGDGVTEERYISLAERARRLIDKGTVAWQRLQAFAMASDELIDSVVLRGQDL